jgi:glycerol uptake facilitator-like aquaporin
MRRWRAAAPIREAVGESLGTAFLLCAVVGSGIMAERLFSGSMGLALLANALATGAVLTALISTFGPVSGAHFNPLVTVAMATGGLVPWTHVPAYLAAQTLGALGGVLTAHAMFDLPLLMLSTHVRAGGAQAFSEFVATFGLVAIVWSTAHRPHGLAPAVVAGYVTAAYWFTASTAFANPAATLARAFTDTFTGIQPRDVPAFVAAQCTGAAAAVGLFAWLVAPSPSGTTTSMQAQRVETPP